MWPKYLRVEIVYFHCNLCIVLVEYLNLNYFIDCYAKALWWVFMATRIKHSTLWLSLLPVNLRKFSTLLHYNFESPKQTFYSGRSEGSVESILINVPFLRFASYRLSFLFGQSQQMAYNFACTETFFTNDNIERGRSDTRKSTNLSHRVDKESKLVIVNRQTGAFTQWWMAQWSSDAKTRWIWFF